MRRTVELPPPQDADAAPWRGAVEWHDQDGWATPWRLRGGPALDGPLGRAAESAVGVRATLRTDARALSLPVRGGGSETQVVDVLVDGELVARTPLPDSDPINVALPGNLSDIEIWLPHTGPCRIGSLRLLEATEAAAAPRPRVSWVAYGSSITQCTASSGPSRTWPAVVSRRLDWDLTCLGFNGLAHLDLPVADTIGAIRPDLVTVCVGINIYNQATMDARRLADRLTEFVTIIGDGSPGARVAVMSPITSPERENTVNAAGLTLTDVRRTIEQTVAGLGPGVSYLDGLAVFGADDADFLSDGLHPDARGYDLMAQRLTPILDALAAGENRSPQRGLHQSPPVVQH